MISVWFFLRLQLQHQGKLKLGQLLWLREACVVHACLVTCVPVVAHEAYVVHACLVTCVPVVAP